MSARQGGIWGLDRGYCLMIGGPDEAVKHLDPVFATLAPGADTTSPALAEGTASLGYLHCGPSGAGHFVKMVHNGIEYGVMAAYAEGINILKSANAGKRQRSADAETSPLSEPQYYQFDIDLPAVTEVWRHGSRHRLMAARPDGGRAEGRPDARQFRRPRVGFRRRPLDAEGRDRHRRAGAGAVVGAVRPVLLAGRVRIRRQAAVGHAVRVRRA